MLKETSNTCDRYNTYTICLLKYTFACYLLAKIYNLTTKNPQKILWKYYLKNVLFSNSYNNACRIKFEHLCTASKSSHNWLVLRFPAPLAYETTWNFLNMPCFLMLLYSEDVPTTWNDMESLFPMFTSDFLFKYQLFW